MKNKALIVTLADENYIYQAKQLFSSVYWNAGWKGDYMLLACEIPEEKLRWFRKKGILVKKCNRFIEGMQGKWPVAVFSKFYLFTPEFKKWENIVFLDADIIVRAPIDELAKVRGFHALGTRKMKKNFTNPLQIKLEKISKKEYKKLRKSYNLKEIQFNSGVLAFSTDTIKENCFSILKKLFLNYKKLSDGDEPILNLFFYKKWKKLPCVYNLNPYYCINFKNVEPKDIQGIILHFHEDKPWKKDNYFYKEWKSNLKKAELINLKKIQKPIAWKQKDIKEYSSSLEKKKYSHKYYVFRLQEFVDRAIGLLGIILKNNMPKIYFKLKEIKMKK